MLPPARAAQRARARHRQCAPSSSGSLSAARNFYLEGQVGYALPLEQNNWWIYSSTQHPGEVQHWVAHALGLDNNAVKVECRRMGGGFGGKETQAGHLAVWAALAARKFKRAVKLRLDRDDDFLVTGKRHPFAYDYDVGFDDDGRRASSDAGGQLRLERGPERPRRRPRGLHADNAYFLGDVEIALPLQDQRAEPHRSAARRPRVAVVIEAILGDIAWALGKDPLDAQANLYGRRRPHRHPLPDDGGGQHPRPLLARREASTTAGRVGSPPRMRRTP